MNLRQSTKFLSLSLGALALSVSLAACDTSAQSSSSANTAASPMNHAGMKHGQDKPKDAGQSMQHGGMKHDMGHSMDLGPADAEYDLRFIDAMIPHHEGAVIMAQDLAQKTKRPELQKLAKEIIAAQDKEIAQMKSWRKAWYPKSADTPMAWHGEMKHSMPMSQEQIKAMRMDMDLGSADAEYDLRFLQAMVPHHEAAVVMAQDLNQKTKRPELQKLAKDIMSSQQIEIDQMKQWQKDWYKK
jgi:uncharacterized protein (DUF305 family)